MKKQKTFAQRAKEIEKKFEGRNDNVSLRTKKALMEQLRMEQEALKQKMEMQNQPQGQTLEEMTMQQSTNQAMFGKLIPGAGEFLKENKEGVQDLAGSMVGAGMNIFGKSDMDTSGSTRPDIEGIQKQNTTNAISGGAKTLASFASGDILGGVTGAIGTIGGLIGGGKQKKAAEEAIMNNDLMQSNNARPDTYMAAYGGKMNSYKNGGKVNSYYGGGPLGERNILGLNNVVDPIGETKQVDLLSGKYTPNNIIENKGSGYKTSLGVDSSNTTNKDNLKFSRTSQGSQDSQDKNSFVDWMGKNAGNIMQYAPVIGALTNKIDRASTPRGSRLTGEVSLGRRDEERLMNDIRSQVNVSGASREGSGGSLSAYNTLSRSGNMNEITGISKARQTMEESNLSQQEKETAMNERNRAINVQLDDKFLDREAQDEGAYQTAKQLNRDAIFQSVGNIGREEVNKKTVKEMFGYKYDGTYVRDDKGQIVLNEETGEPLTNEELQERKKLANQEVRKNRIKNKKG